MNVFMDWNDTQLTVNLSKYNCSFFAKLRCVCLVLWRVHRLSEKLQMMTLTSDNTASQSEDSSEAGKELKLNVNQQELQMMMMKSTLQQTNEAVQSLLHQHPAVHHTGPPPPSTQRNHTKPPVDMRGSHTATRDSGCLESTSKKWWWNYSLCFLLAFFTLISPWLRL